MYFHHYWWSVESQINLHSHLFGSENILSWLSLFHSQNCWKKLLSLCHEASFDQHCFLNSSRNSSLPMCQACTTQDILIFKNCNINRLILVEMFCNTFSYNSQEIISIFGPTIQNRIIPWWIHLTFLSAISGSGNG